MKLTTAVLAAGVAVSLTSALVGTARFIQAARHQAERNDAIITRNQLDWLAQVSTDADLAKLWTPEGMDASEYQEIQTANRLICMLSLRDRLGFVRPRQLPIHAKVLMSSEAGRRYWAKFGDLRTEEAEGDPRAERFTDALDMAAQDHQQGQPAV